MNMSHKEFFKENQGQSRNFRNETFEKESNYNSYNHKVHEKAPDESQDSSHLDEFSYVVS